MKAFFAKRINFTQKLVPEKSVQSEARSQGVLYGNSSVEASGFAATKLIRCFNGLAQVQNQFNLSLSGIFFNRVAENHCYGI